MDKYKKIQFNNNDYLFFVSSVKDKYYLFGEYEMIHRNGIAETIIRDIPTVINFQHEDFEEDKNKIFNTYIYLMDQFNAQLDFDMEDCYWHYSYRKLFFNTYEEANIALNSLDLTIAVKYDIFQNNKKFIIRDDVFYIIQKNKKFYITFINFDNYKFQKVNYYLDKVIVNPIKTTRFNEGATKIFKILVNQYDVMPDVRCIMNNYDDTRYMYYDIFFNTYEDAKKVILELPDIINAHLVMDKLSKK